MNAVAEPLDRTDVDITEKDIKEALKEPTSFAYFGSRGESQMFITWSLGPVFRTRDSEVIAQSNARILIKKLESDPTLKDEWTITGCSHWACGWVDHLSFRVLDNDNKPTRIFRVIKGWFEDLQDYSIADEDDCQQLAEELSLKHLPYICKNLLIDNPPEGWEHDLYSALTETHSTLEELYPSEDEVRPLLADLNLLKPDEDSDAPVTD